MDLKNAIFGCVCAIATAIHGTAEANAASGDRGNMAVHLDGNDNNLRTGMGFLEPAGWTLEAWIKSDTTSRKELEYIFGGGEYSTFSDSDNAALVLKNGRLHATAAGLTDTVTIDGNWHHVALSCDGHSVSIYRDGEETARRDTAYKILPGTIGVGETDGTFSGYIDEVRIWSAAVDGSTLGKWMCKPLSPRHPYFDALHGYYPLDDFDGETAVNWVGKGNLSYHIRGGRNKFRENAPLARAVPNDNPRFSDYYGPMRLFNAVAVQSEWDSDRGSRDQQVLKLRIAVQGDKKRLRLDGLALDLSGTTDLADIERVHIYYTGSKARSTGRTELFGEGLIPKPLMELQATDGGMELREGINYILVTFDIAPGADIGNTLCATVPSFTLNGKSHTPATDSGFVHKEVTANSRSDTDYIKVLQWNIWHGGVHLADSGRLRVIELLKKSTADIIMMQEAYGIQRQAADSLGYHLQTHGPSDNLAIYSRFALEPHPWREPFKSNHAVATTGNGRRILLVDTWLRYAYRPEYTCYYPEPGMDPARWMAEDSLLALKDITAILDNDVARYREPDMPVVLTGDFNSCSHLDWTVRARDLHYGYGPVDFPVSRYMKERGYTDTFRDLHPDEVARPEGTWAVIYGHTQTSRIDFIYSAGDIVPVQSKIVRTMPEIDYVWPSDHAAVITLFMLPRPYKDRE